MFKWIKEFGQVLCPQMPELRSLAQESVDEAEIQKACWELKLKHRQRDLERLAGGRAVRAQP